MAILKMRTSQLVVVGGVALVIAAAPAAVVSLSAPGVNPTQVATCRPGEDLRGGVCVSVEPNAPQADIPGNPDLPAVDIPGGAIPCTGANTGECIGLTESGQGREPAVRPTSKFGDIPVAP
ncbi:intersectin-EH binding protein Ibp1 [Mycobacterium sp. TNTM28]|uniref:Intersectin-EH binding protein Ibp1 n=1 Tax=[Mycobacterium] fortunisiensis TaxID=2600579 RepID=A0ABS6KI43_9MYCO|nr:intersectin-EH binding protein Ibp1 [[Mycobacterium] fortunisiensis]MBU9763237.1 intersectin-EH binding protein Ibp1 [[Mycobacterium] fortunisiensis]